MTAIAQKRQRLNLLLLTEDNQRETSLLEALHESRTRCRLLCAPLGKDTIQYLERKGQYEGAPKADLVFFDGRRAGGEALTLLRKIKRRRSLDALPIVLLVDDETQPLLENVDTGSARSTAFAPVDLQDFLASLNNAAPDRFLRAIRLLEKFGYVLVRQRIADRCSNGPFVRLGGTALAAGANAS